jgi:TolB protein
VHTVATVRGHVVGFAQDGRYLAWLLPGPANQFGAGNVGAVVMHDLRTGVQTKIPSDPQGYWPLGPQGLALVGDRAYWEQTGGTNNTVDAALVTAAVHDRRQRGIGSEEVAADSPQDTLQPVVSDGTNAYFWSSSDPDFFGPIVRFEGLTRKRIGRGIEAPAALAAGGGRLARAVHVYDYAGSPAWSPDGKQIAFARNGDGIWVVDADGTNPHMIAARGNNPDWSPDGTRLVYDVGGDKVVVANADGTDPQVVTSGDDPAWSPDGLKLAVVRDYSIWIVTLNDRGDTLVVPNGVEPDWSPDGRELVYAGGEGLNAVWLANADGSKQHMLAPSGLATPHPAWSPDGAEIAWVSPDCGTSNDPGICEIHPDGTGEQTLPVGNVNTFDKYDPAWGPTSKSLLLVSDDHTADGDAHVFVWPGLRQVTRRAQAMPIVVSTSGGRRGAQFESSGPVEALAVSRLVVAALISDAGHPAIEIYQPTRRIVPLAGSAKDQLAISGMTLVFQVGDTIETLDALYGSPRPVAHTSSYAIGLSIVGRRVAWADNGARGARIRELQLP